MKILQAKKSGTQSVATVETQQNMRRAIKEIEEQLAIGGRKQLTGLQKWQLAVKFLAMSHDDSQFDYLDRHNKADELNINRVMTNEVEKLVEQKDLYTEKHAQGLRREQAKQLRYQKVSQQIRADRHKELVTRNFEADAIAEFDKVYEKLMCEDKEEKLDEIYIGKTQLAPQPSLNALSYIK